MTYVTGGTIFPGGTTKTPLTCESHFKGVDPWEPSPQRTPGSCRRIPGREIRIGVPGLAMAELKHREPKADQDRICRGCGAL